MVHFLPLAWPATGRHQKIPRIRHKPHRQLKPKSMNINFSAAIGDLLVHFYKTHQLVLTEQEVWLINNVLMCTDDMFDGFNMISDILGIAFDSEDGAAILKYHEALEVLATATHPMEVSDRYRQN